MVSVCWSVLHLLAPPNLLQNNEHRMAAYVADIVHNGEWIYPRDALGKLMSKPPACAWLMAITARLTGRIDVFELYFPSILSAALITVLLWRTGRRYGGPAAGFLSAFAWLASPAVDWLMATARYDGLFSLFVLIMALAALRAWETGRGWTWFWLAGAAATLVKGPLGVVLGAAGLLAALWERRSVDRAPLRGRHAIGLLCFVGLLGAWLAMAWGTAGSAILDRLIGEELVGNSLGLHESARHPAWYRPLGNWMGKLAPWSVAAVIAVVRAVRSPSPDPRRRRLERFLASALLVGLTLFTLSPHRQARMILPLVPFGALLAGPLLASWVRRWPPGRVALLLVAAAAVPLGEAAYERLVQEPRRTPVRSTRAYQQLARQWRDLAGAGFPLTHVDPPIPFELALQEIRPVAAPAHALDLLHGADAAFVVVSEAAWQDLPLLSENGSFRRLLEVPGPGTLPVAIWGNRARPTGDEPVACLVGELELHLEGLQLVRGFFNHVAVRTRGRPGRLQVINRGAVPSPVHVVVEGSGGQAGERILAPGEAWTLEIAP